MWTVTAEANQAPILTAVGDQSNEEGDIVNLSLIATDGNGDVLSFSATGLPDGLSLDSASGLISGTLSFDSAGSYNVVVTVTDGTDPDSESLLWTVADMNRPPILTAPGDRSNQEGDLVNLPLIATDIDGDALTFSASDLPPGLSIDPDTGIISGTLPVGSSGTYSVTGDVTDGIDVVSTVFPWTVTVESTGQILREWWTGITGKRISALTGHADYPLNPTGSDLLTQFEAPTNWTNHYGNRVRGYIHPPTTGDYTFWIASDDESELWLSTDEFASSAVLIAHVPSWTYPREWMKLPEQQSVTIPLQAGQKYYIEALHKEGPLLDNLSVAWQGPGLSQQVIDGAFLSAFSVAGGNQPPILTPPGDQSNQEGDIVSLPLIATDEDRDPLSFSATGLPPGLAIDPATGMISGTLPAGSSEIYPVTINVTDGIDVASTIFIWNVAEVTGQILREWWMGVGGKDVRALTNHPSFPDNPTGSELLTQFEAPTDFGNNYGNRVRGYIHPPTSGDYTFWIAADSRGELWLSLDESPSAATLIAYTPSFTLPREWTKFPEQQSVTITLQAGQKYYIEALHMEQGFGDNLSVAWQGPGLSQQVIDGVYLSPYSDAPLSADLGGQNPAIAGLLVQEMVEDATENHTQLQFSGAVEPEGQGYRILCSPDLTIWDDCSDQFRLTERIFNSNDVPPTVTLKWINEMEQSSQEFFRIELQPLNTE